MCDSFHDAGKQPVLSEMLNKFVTDGAMFFATGLSILAEIPSGPFHFEISSVSRWCCTSSLEHKIPSVSSSAGSKSSRLAKFKGGTE